MQVYVDLNGNIQFGMCLKEGGVLEVIRNRCWRLRPLIPGWLNDGLALCASMPNHLNNAGFGHWAAGRELTSEEPFEGVVYEDGRSESLFIFWKWHRGGRPNMISCSMTSWGRHQARRREFELAPSPWCRTDRPSQTKMGGQKPKK